MIDCNSCANRGRVNGLSQESFCESCIYSEKWKTDNYKPKDTEDAQIKTKTQSA